METVRPLDFSSDTPPPRLMGTEVENSLLSTCDSATNILIANRVTAAAAMLGESDFVLCSGRFYYDPVGAAEFATPECRGPEELFFYERVGRQILKDCAEVVFGNERITNGNKNLSFTQLSAYCNQATESTPGGIATTGYHENYITPAEFKHQAVPALLSLLAVRDIVCGSGYFDHDGKFSIGAKVHDIGAAMNTEKVRAGAKPMIQSFSTTENHANTAWRRIEVRCGDVTVTPWATVMKLGMCSLALRLVEHNYFPDKLLLKNPLTAFQSVAKSEHGQVLVENSCGNKLVPTVWLRYFAEACLNLAESVRLPNDEVTVAQELIRFTDNYETDRWSIADRSEAAGKLQLANEKNLLGNSRKLQSLQLTWAKQDGSDGIAGRLMRRGDFDTEVFSVPEVTQTDIPPATRAKLRVALHEEHKDKTNKSVDWGICCGILMPEPYKAA